MTPVTRRRTPEELLLQVQAEEAHDTRGRLKIFLGYASGVGKSFRMLDEGRRRAERGQDVAVGAIQLPATPDVEELLKNLEVIPLRKTDGASVMDVPAILKRMPRVCLVDGLAWDNPPGSMNPSRWQDVRQLLDAGIAVIASINIQYIAELQGQVEKITGKHVTHTVPQSFLYGTDEIAVVDAPPEMCFGHSGQDVAGDPARIAHQLSELREIALLFAADVVDHQLETYLKQNGVAVSYGTQERILVCITPRTSAKAMIASGKRNAERFHGELIAAHVRQGRLDAQAKAALDRNLEVARQAGAHIEILEGDDPIEAILEFARERGITQIFMGHGLDTQWWHRWTGGPVGRLIRGAQGIDVRVFPQ
jgi:two-component system, OmpR family, sensor histidine kinase KdpD